MKAIVMNHYGSSDVLQVVETKRPLPKPDEVLIQVHATSINPVDWKIRSGFQKGIVPVSFPHILGMDVSGVVVEVGKNVSGFAVGDEVYSSPSHKRQGTYAEFVCTKASEIAKKPSNLSHEEAASIPLVGLTAWEALVVQGEVKPGDRVFIQAGSGGVGSFAIQLAKSQGAYVITTCSERNIELVKELGADEVIDYRKQAFEEVIKDVDIVLDTISGDTRDKNLQVLKRGGKQISITADIPTYVKKYGRLLGFATVLWRMLSFKFKAKSKFGVSYKSVVRQSNGSMLSEITKLCEEGKIVPVIDSIHPPENIQEAHKLSESSRARGKIVIAFEHESSTPALLQA